MGLAQARPNNELSVRTRTRRYLAGSRDSDAALPPQLTLTPCSLTRLRAYRQVVGNTVGRFIFIEGIVQGVSPRLSVVFTGQLATIFSLS